MASIIRGDDNFDSSDVVDDRTVAKAWFTINPSSSNALEKAYNVTSVTEPSGGYYTVNFPSGLFSDGNYVGTVSADGNNTGGAAGCWDMYYGNSSIQRGIRIQGTNGVVYSSGGEVICGVFFDN